MEPTTRVLANSVIGSMNLKLIEQWRKIDIKTRLQKNFIV